MVIEIPCQTPGAVFHITVYGSQVAVSVDLPLKLELTEEEAAVLEANIHNAIELVLIPYW